MQSFWPRMLLLQISLYAGACQGLADDGGSTAGGPVPSAGGEPPTGVSEPPEPVDGSARPGEQTALDLALETPSSTIRRLSRRELGNAIEALIGLRPHALAEVPADGNDSGFDRVVEDQTITMRHVEGFSKMADEIGAHLLGTLHTGAIDEVADDCRPETAPAASDVASDHRACVSSFLRELGPRALRRPLREGELARFMTLYDASSTYQEGLELVAHALFRHPSFLYLVEEGSSIAERPGLLALTQFELAARLSFGLCETIPDDVLWQAAEHGQLGDAGAVEDQARRLLGLPCARDTLGRFFAQWLRYEEAPSLSRDPTIHPQFNTEVARALQRETDAFVSHVLWDSAGTLEELFAADYGFVDPASSYVHGLEQRAEFARVALPSYRRGILTHPSLLAISSKENESSPVRRGVFVLERLLCQELPAPPIEVEVPEIDERLTTRERSEQHAADPACASCHSLIDPVGFALERFDAVGRYRETEQGRPIDDSGGLPSFGIAYGDFAGGAGLAEAVAAQPALAQCFARHWLRNTLGRKEARSDIPVLTELTELIRSNQKLSELLPLVVQTEPFLTRRTAP